MSCHLQTIECVLGWVAVNAACLCRLYLEIPTPRVLDVGVGNVQAIRLIAIVMIGHWNSGRFIIKDVFMPSVIDPLVAILATPLSQTPLPHVLQLPAPLPPPPPPPSPSEGPVSGEETSSEDSKRTRVSSSPPLPLGEQGERGGGGGHKHGADCGWERFSPSPPFGRGDYRAILSYQPPPIVTKAQTSPRPNSLISPLPTALR